MLPSPLARTILSLSSIRTSSSSNGIPSQVKVTQWGSSLEEAKHTIFYFGGLPTSGEEPALHSIFSSQDDVYKTRKIHLVCIDKPGMGGSTLAYRFQIRRDWPVIVDEVANQLKLTTEKGYGVIGVSNGGPYAMATLTHPTLKHNIKAAAMVVGVSDVLASGYFTWRSPSTVMEGLYNSLPTILTGPLTLVGLALARIYMVHFNGYQSLLNLPPGEAKPIVDQFLKDGMHYGGIPASIDCQQGLSPLFARNSKDCDPTSVNRNAVDAYSAINIPVTLWYGTKDSSVPLTSAEWLAETIGTNAKLNTLDTGHGLYLYHPEKVLDELVRLMDDDDDDEQQ